MPGWLFQNLLKRNSGAIQTDISVSFPAVCFRYCASTAQSAAQGVVKRCPEVFFSDVFRIITQLMVLFKHCSQSAASGSTILAMFQVSRGDVCQYCSSTVQGTTRAFYSWRVPSITQ
jgi:hypothetical protein